MCSCPAGEGANRVTTGEAGIGIQEGKAATPARGRLLVARSPSLPSLGDLKAQAAAQADRWGLWSPVALGAGCAIYIGLRQEPGWGALIGLFAMSLVLTVWASKRGLVRLLVMATTL